ncbi:2-desacetyl-2-hydroxyethyl bacteriochlorophyllide A dehydrogenase [Microbacterium resistens]|uniref:2-desacetyl-2-hydroxyethyl bacteriochlorophyllide A dehydrogenase n=1 Tax=Microbacterium resistens TaxID=156977 RepID=A0ABU1SDC2_9MICO|nr:zinc-binding dehydrogenase [Microbacterium resistens]MDR6867599.1 2-desacetyl-2-hydroxyethyl bacteriochlorophyllide A dehydrogenase [Microbacterium resistens]
MSMSQEAPETIRAVRLVVDRPPVLAQVPRPEVGPKDVRLAITYGGICLSDLHYIDGERAPGMPDELTLGHELSGTVSEVGTEVTRWTVGDPAIVSPVGERDGIVHIVGVHRDGGWADEIVVGQDDLVSAEGIPLDQATIIPDAVSTPWAAITDSGRVRPTEAVGVWGLGGLGYHAVQLLRLIGAAPIVAIDPNPVARQRALDRGADAALDPGEDGFEERLSALTDGRGLDVAMDFFGHASIQQQAFDALGRHGRLVLVGIPNTPLVIDSSPQLVRSGRQIIGHHGLATRHIEEVVSLIRHGRLDLSQSISAILPLEDFAEAIDRLRTKTGSPIRILLRA